MCGTKLFSPGPSLVPVTIFSLGPDTGTFSFLGPDPGAFSPGLEKTFSEFVRIMF
jgi:hypothetical protein